MSALKDIWNWLLARVYPRRLLLLRENSQRWKKLKKEHLKKESECAVCGRRANLEVHHIIPVSFDASKQFDSNNLITLCATPCHFSFGHFFCYHCYNKDVRKMAAEFKKAMHTKRNCLERFR